MFGLGFQELLIILIIVLFLFGGKRLPEIASGLGKGLREFKRAASAPEAPDVPVTQITEHAVRDETKQDGTGAP